MDLFAVIWRVVFDTPLALEGTVKPAVLKGFAELRRLSENEIFFSRSRKGEIITTGMHRSILRIIISA